MVLKEKNFFWGSNVKFIRNVLAYKFWLVFLVFLLLEIEKIIKFKQEREY